MARGIVSAIILLAAAGSTRASELTVRAPDGCVDAESLKQEVADLVGRPLAEIPDVDFELAIAPRPPAGWHLKLLAHQRPASAADASPRVRELDARSCPELAEAAAVAIAVSIRAFADAAVASRREAGTSVAPPSPAPTLIVNAQQPAAVQPSGAWQPAVHAALGGDIGELPGAGLGVFAGAALSRRWARLDGTIGWLPSRETAPPLAGRFQLAFGAVDACFAPTWRNRALRACGGAELGAYWAAGVAVRRPGSATTLWRAGRASVGALIGLGGALSLCLEATAVFPFSRPQFVLDGASPVYQSARVAGRLAIGLEIGL
jgi:hypothetical protein